MYPNWIFNRSVFDGFETFKKLRRSSPRFLAGVAAPLEVAAGEGRRGRATERRLHAAAGFSGSCRCCFVGRTSPERRRTGRRLVAVRCTVSPGATAEDLSPVGGVAVVGVSPVVFDGRWCFSLAVHNSIERGEEERRGERKDEKEVAPALLGSRRLLLAGSLGCYGFRQSKDENGEEREGLRR
uniref:Uncharacterized protein n=1 Tax=Spongospora subterranea TaxID=70186 RepID=A0A0H5QUL9_9EUKA|eukprot:CRZ05708.1 hypothetical protein [Spongospora subterranea]